MIIAANIQKFLQIHPTARQKYPMYGRDTAADPKIPEDLIINMLSP